MIPTRGTDSTLEPAYFAKIPKKCENGGSKPSSNSSFTGLVAVIANGLIGKVGDAIKIEEEQ